MPMVTTVERMLNERSTDELLNPNSITSIIRREMFRGLAVKASDFQLSALQMQQIASQMRHYGFEVERVAAEDGTTAYKLMNPDHMPAKGQRTKRASRSRNKDAGAALTKAFMSGQSMDRNRAMREFGVGKDALRHLVFRLRSAGHEILHEGDTYRLADPNHVPIPVAATASAPRRERSSQAALPTLPALGEMVEVYMLAKENDGVVKLGLKSGEHVWLCSIEGHLQRETSGG